MAHSIVAHQKVNAETDATIAELQQEPDKLTAKMWLDPKSVTPR